MIQVIDFETTGLGSEAAPAQPIQYGQVVLLRDLTICDEDTNEVIICPTVPIEWGAMGVHQLTNEYVEFHKDFDYDDVSEGKWVLPSTKYLVAHNAQYDTKFICSEQLANVKVVCTLKLARKLIDKKLCGDHKNMTLYYYLGCYKNPIGAEHIGQSHSALSDAMVTANILYAMLTKFKLTIEEAYQLISKEKELPEQEEDITICPFTKHKGISWKEVVKSDRDYCEWLLNAGKIRSPKMEQYVKEMVYA
jgi:DNA polymerase III epsilon subunit-like protein